MFYCPICLKEYNESIIDECICGFKDYHFYDHNDETLFKIFKYTKNVFYNRIDYPESKIEIIYHDEHDYIDIISKERGLEVIEGPYCASEGILAFRYHTKALILNTHYAHHNFLDESRVDILFIGKDFIGFIGEPRKLNRIKYLYVHKDNPYYYSQNNILLKK